MGCYAVAIGVPGGAPYELVSRPVPARYSAYGHGNGRG